MNKKRPYTYPNLLEQRFNVSNPFAVLCADCTQLDIVLEDNPEQKVKFFCVIDLCTGQLIASYVFTRVYSGRMKNLVASYLNRKKGTCYEEQQTIIHSDRGTEFCNRNWCSLIECGHVQISMSRKAKPLDNSVIERMFGTVKRDKKILGQSGSYDSIPESVKSINELRALMDNLVFRYNTSYKPKRTLFTPPDTFAQLLFAGQADNVQKTVLSHTRYNKSDTANILEYKKQILKDYKDELAKINTKLDVINSNQIEMATQVGERFVQVLDRLDVIDDKVTKNVRKKSRPRLQRDPLTESHLELFLKTSLDHEPYVSVRNKTAILLLSALGCRNSEINELTFAKLESLIIHKQISLYIRKTKKYICQPISDFHADLLKLFYDDLISIIGVIDSGWYVFASVRDKSGKHLHQKHFNTILNDSLRSFCIKCNLDNEYTTHSGRIGYVTSLMQAGHDVSVVAKLVNHEDIRSTMKYDRYVMSVESKRDILNKNVKKQI